MSWSYSSNSHSDQIGTILLPAVDVARLTMLTFGGDVDVPRQSGLREVEFPYGLKFLPDFPLARSVLVPAFERADQARGMFGFFTSGILRRLSHGLASYLNRSTEPMELIVSPELPTQDREAILQGIASPREALSERLRDSLLDPAHAGSALEQHAVQCLTWLLASGRLHLRVGFSTEQGRLYHPKTWLLRCGADVVAVHGSSNATMSGVGGNTEQVHVALSWLEGHRQDVQDLIEEFEAQWDDRSKNARTYVVDERVARILKEAAPESQPSMRAYVSALQEDIERGIYNPGTSHRGRTVAEPPGEYMSFEIPEGVDWQTGPYAHQGEAVEAWEAADRHGVFEMATGAGKTITALIAARKAMDAGSRPLLIVISAPTAPLVSQWAEEARSFGLRPILPTHEGNRRDKFAAVDAALRDLKFRVSDVECIIVTNNLLNDPHFRSAISHASASRMLIGDEVHTLGARGFVEHPPEFFELRLGLSATPIRQYDEEGTKELFDYFGGLVYEYGLDLAIGQCLVEYDYYVHPVQLTDEELERFAELTAKIVRRMKPNAASEDDEALQRLLIRRREILESAEGKVSVLRSCLESHDRSGLEHTLIYATAKNPQQLIDINTLLASFGVTYHQVTQQESADRRLLTGIIDNFRAGTIQVLTAKKVLDEGVNIPEIERAFLVASSGVEREWVQRRGRVLRQCAKIGKSHAVLHDFIVVPPPKYARDTYARNLVRRELERVQAFAQLARNAGEPGSGSLVASDLIIDFFGSN